MQTPRAWMGIATPVADRDADQMQLYEAVGITVACEHGPGEYEAGIADLFMDDGNGMDFVANIYASAREQCGEETKNNVAVALTTAGVTVEKTNIYAAAMCQRAQTATLIAVYGRSVRDQSRLKRRILLVESLNALDLGTTKPNGETEDFCKRSYRRLARQMVDEQQPD